MNWEAIGAVGEIFGALAVVATLGYLAVQIRHIKTQNESSTLQHVTDGFMDFTGRIAESESLALIVARGRASYSSLSAEESLRFDCIYLSLLNIFESWYAQVDGELLGITEDELDLRDATLYYCDYPGFREVWANAKPMFPVLAPFMDQSLETSDASSPVGVEGDGSA